MPQRSFLGVGVLIGLIAGAMFGLQTGNLAFGIIGGVIVGVALALLIDWLARLRPGQGADGGGDAESSTAISQAPATRITVIMGMVMAGMTAAMAVRIAAVTAVAATDRPHDQRARIASSTARAARSVSASGS
jgi:hypothetical protein